MKFSFGVLGKLKKKDVYEMKMKLKIKNKARNTYSPRLKQCSQNTPVATVQRDLFTISKEGSNMWQ